MIRKPGWVDISDGRCFIIDGCCRLGRMEGLTLKNKEGKKGRLLILCDGKPGHVNQSIAFARHLDLEHDLVSVTLQSGFHRLFSYIADFFGLYSESLFSLETVPEVAYGAVVSAGSGTYYANRTLAKKLGCQSVAIMHPGGYRKNFDLIIVQEHDRPPRRANIVSVPVNLSFIEPQGLVIASQGQKYVAIIIGGSSDHYTIDVGHLKEQINLIFSLFPEHRVWLTTSRRTPPEVDQMLAGFSFDRAVVYSREKINPIPDFLQNSDYVFVTADSSSMISEAVSYGNSFVEILPPPAGLRLKGKFAGLITRLEKLDCLHVFDGQCGNSKHKIDLGEKLRKALFFGQAEIQ